MRLRNKYQFLTVEKIKNEKAWIIWTREPKWRESSALYKFVEDHPNCEWQLVDTNIMTDLPRSRRDVEIWEILHIPCCRTMYNNITRRFMKY